jgi:transcriptional regulator with XRE-family HTH domain
VTVRAVASALGVSIAYASNIRSGKRHPHARHWKTLARLVGIVPPSPREVDQGSALTTACKPIPH